MAILLEDFDPGPCITTEIFCDDYCLDNKIFNVRKSSCKESIQEVLHAIVMQQPEESISFSRNGKGCFTERYVGFEENSVITTISGAEELISNSLEEEILSIKESINVKSKLNKDAKETSDRFQNESKCCEDSDLESEDEYEHVLNNNKITEYGKGQYGSVFAIRNKSTLQTFALKKLKITSDKERQSALNEVEIHCMLSHENIIRFICYDESEDDYINIIMNSVSGGSLADFLTKYNGLQNENGIAHYTSQIICGLQYMHQKQILHLDIKCKNILIDEHSGKCMLADFGCSHNMANGVAKGIRGTPNFTAPEVLVSNEHDQCGYGKPADIWSVGCTVIEMVQCKVPFSEFEQMTIVFHVGRKKEHPPFPKNISSKLSAFLESCFKEEPESRASVEELLQSEFIERFKRRRKDDSVCTSEGNGVESDSRLVTEEHGVGLTDTDIAEQPTTDTDAYLSFSVNPEFVLNVRQERMKPSNTTTDSFVLCANTIVTKSPLEATDETVIRCIGNELSNVTISTTDTSEEADDARLLSWLRDLRVQRSEIQKFFIHLCTFDDVLNLLQLEDLKEMDIAIGPRARIWDAIMKHRTSLLAQA